MCFIVSVNLVPVTPRDNNDVPFLVGLFLVCVSVKMKVLRSILSKKTVYVHVV